MAVYCYGKDSPITEVTIRRSEGGGVRAYAEASAGADPARLEAIKSSLTSKHMQCVPVMEGSKPMLEIRGFGKKDDALIQALNEAGAVKGRCEKKSVDSDVIKPQDRLSKNTLAASGYSYFVGDAGFLTYGWKDAFSHDASGNRKLTKPQNLFAGIFYAMGSPFIAFFGRGDKSDFQMKEMGHSVLEECKRQGVALADDSPLKRTYGNYNKTFKQKLSNFCHRHPSEITNSMFGLAGSMIIWDSIIKLRQPYDPNNVGLSQKVSASMDIGLGAMSMAGGLVSTLVQEEPRAPDEPKKTGIARIGQWVKEKPLRAAGGAFVLSTICHMFSTLVAWRGANAALRDPASSAEKISNAKEIKSTLLGRAVFVASAFVSEALMFVSSKGHGHGVKTDSSLDRSVYGVMADAVLRQPEGKREATLETMAHVLSQKKHLGGKAEDIKKHIQESMQALSGNPWATTARHVPNTPAQAEPEQASSPYWQNRIAPTGQALHTPALA